LGRYGQIPIAVGFVYQNESCEFDFRQCWGLSKLYNDNDMYYWRFPSFTKKKTCTIEDLQALQRQW